MAEEDSESDADIGPPSVVPVADCGNGPACPVEPRNPSSTKGNDEGTGAMTVGDGAKERKGGTEKGKFGEEEEKEGGEVGGEE
jgi:hypothetical protein